MMRSYLPALAIAAVVGVAGCGDFDDELSDVTAVQATFTTPAPALPPMVFMRNVAVFTAGREMEGAGASLFEMDGKIFILTAKHLLSETAGVKPELKPHRFNREFISWEVMPNRTYHSGARKAVAGVTEMLRPDSDMRFDLIVLETGAKPEDVATMTLPLSNAPALPGAPIFIVGCTLVEEGACDQNLYPAVVKLNSQGDIMTFDFAVKRPDINGMAGAPIVNADGEIVGIVTAPTGKNGGVGTPIPSWLMEKGR